MSTSLTYSVQVATGSTNTTLSDMSRGVSGVTRDVGGLQSALQRVGAGAFVFNNIAQSIGSFTNAINQAVAPGIALDDSLMDLKAITGATDGQLKQIKESARALAPAFGVDAAGGVESYKVLLSKLTPELAKTPAALAGMGNQVATLSKQLKGDTVGAAELLSTAMNQYGVSLDNPMQATRTMGVMMNIMSKAAQEGSAELPQIKSALEQAGMMAKSANVSFAETNAAIQVLDKAGKQGAEGGVAIRNILGEMALGARQPKVVAEGMKALGIDLNKLSDNSLTFSQRLGILKPALQNQGLLTQMVGKENIAATIALLNGTNELDRYTKAIVGSNSAYDMARDKMGSYQEKMDRIWGTIKNFGISVFDSIRPALPAFQIIGSGVQFMAQLGGMANTVGIIMNTSFGQSMIRATAASWGFIRSLFVSSLSLVRVGIQYALTGAMMLGGFVTSLVTATAAQLGLNIAMTANPIGLIIVGIAAAVGAIVLLVKHWDWIKQKIMDFGKWAYDHSPFKFLIDVADKVFPGFKKQMEALWDWVKGKFDALVGWLKDAFGWIKKLFSSDTSKEATEQSVQDFADATKAAIPGIEVPNAAQKNSAITGANATSKESKETASNITGGGNRPMNINIHVGKFQDKIEIHTTNLKEGVDDIIRLIDERFLGLLNSANSLQTR